jgi:hypothetical protein
VSVAVDGIFAALQGIEPRSPSAAAFYDDYRGAPLRRVLS